MKNSEILGFQLEPTKALQPDSSLGENCETCSSADSEPSTTTRNEASAHTWCMRFNCIQMLTVKECLWYHELNAYEYFKIRKLYIYLLNGKFFFCFSRQYLISLFIAYCIINTLFFHEKLIYKKLGFSCLNVQGASTGAIIFPTKFSFIEN